MKKGVGLSYRNSIFLFTLYVEIKNLKMRYLLLGFLLCTLAACSPKKIISLDEYRGKTIQFGSAGGFSGLETRYCLLENGNLYKIPIQGEEQKRLLLQIPRNESKQIFENYKTFNLGALESQEVGNHYYFLEYHSKKGDKKIQWSKSTNKELSIFHKILYNYTK